MSRKYYCVESESLMIFFSSRRRHTRYWRDWSSDVCSSDLGGHVGGRRRGVPSDGGVPQVHVGGGDEDAATGDRGRVGREGGDRKSGALGQSVDLGGRRNIKKKILE